MPREPRWIGKRGARKNKDAKLQMAGKEKARRQTRENTREGNEREGATVLSQPPFSSFIHSFQSRLFGTPLEESHRERFPISMRSMSTTGETDPEEEMRRGGGKRSHMVTF